MIVSASKLQRDITRTGIDKVLKIATDAAGYLKRLNRSPREAESVINLITNLKAELDKVPSAEQDTVAIEVSPDLAKAWLTALAEYTRVVTLLEKKVNAQPELGGIRNANSTEDAADKLASQMQDQLHLPIQSLESIVAQQDENDKEFGKGTESAPHRGVGNAGTPDNGVGPNSTEAADPRSRRGPAGAKGKKWDRTHRKATNGEPQLPPAAGVQAHRDGPANKDAVESLRTE
ncbi:MAG TPA: hypothetical protein VGI97_14640 [Gemmatimonadaceae bacterium]|jgi:hypothetical protein